ncbi:MAG: glycosyl hydrolase [Gammaproteobacteria bacterium]|nr:glycosyl hydrolase [Gammaproteobacteria bacterium]
MSGNVAGGRLRGLTLLVATKKGAFFIVSSPDRSTFELQGPAFLGHIIHHVIADPRDSHTLLAAARTGHLGPTVFRSTDCGATWEEAQRPPAFAPARDGRRKDAVESVFWLTPGHASEPGVWYAGTSPEGLFRSEDAGAHWEPVAGWNDHEKWIEWTGDGERANPGGSPLHSILIDPRDAKHMYFATSTGGVFETRDQGGTWDLLNTGMMVDFQPDPHPEYGYDPHCVILHPQEPDVLYQQNHCGIYRMHRPQARWHRIGYNMPKEVGDIGFPIVSHPRNPDMAWVFPMDGTDVWPRTPPDNRPAVYRTEDAGQSWQRMDAGLPAPAWYTVYRQAMATDSRHPLGVYFGTTCGEVWAGLDEGSRWQRLAAHLPDVYAVEVAEFES